MKRVFALLMIGAASVALAGCGGSGDESGSESAGVGTPDAPSVVGSGLASGAKTPDTAMGAPAGGSEAAGVEGDVSSADGVMDAFMAEMKEADLRGALAYCVADSQGALTMANTANGWDKAVSDGIDREMLRGMFKNDYSSLEWTRSVEEEERVIYRVSRPHDPDKAPSQVQAVLVDGRWWIVPPTDGTL